MLSLNEEQQLIERLIAGDESAFVDVVRGYHTSMCKLASIFVGDPAKAEEVVQEVWLVVIADLHKFQGRSSLKTWLWRILVNKAKSRATREARQIPWSPQDLSAHQSPDAYRFSEKGCWSAPPAMWGLTPEDTLIQSRLLDIVRDTIKVLPSLQGIVLTMRDVQGFSASETCELLEITPSHHRVVLHRARAAVREAIDLHYSQGQANLQAQEVRS